MIVIRCSLKSYQNFSKKRNFTFENLVGVDNKENLGLTAPRIGRPSVPELL